MFTPTLRHLFHPDNLEEYLDSIRAGSDHLAATLGRVSGPSTGTSPREAAAPVAEIDLDEPVEDLDERPRGALAGLPRRRDLVPRAVVRRPPELPRRHPGPARRAVRLLGELLAGHLRPERRRHPHRAATRRVDGRPDRLPDLGRAGPARVGPAPTASSPAAAPSPTCRPCCWRATPPSRRTASPSTGCASSSPPTATSVSRSPRGCSGLAPDAVVPVPFDAAHRMRVADARVGAAASASTTTSCRWPWSRRPAPPTSVRSTRCAGSPRVCDRFGVWLHVDAAYGGGLLASRRRRHLLDGIELADSVTVDFHKTWFLPGLGERRGRARRPHPAPRDAPRRLPEPEGGHRPQPGRQEPADHAPLRRAQALDDAADHGAGLRRRLLRRRDRPRPAGARGDRADARHRGRGAAEPEHARLPLPARARRRGPRRRSTSRSAPSSTGVATAWSRPPRSTAPPG